MKVTAIVFIAIAAIGQLGIGVMGCNKDKEGANTQNNNQAANPEIALPVYEESLGDGDITFTLLENLGKGATAKVYPGRTKSGIALAVKIYDKNSKGLETFKREHDYYIKLDAINNENVLKYGISPIYFVGEFRGAKVLVMLRFDRDLTDVLIDRFVNPTVMWLNTLLRLFIALKYAHSKGVIHGDISTSNMMAYLNLIILIDFGGIPGKNVSENTDILETYLEMCLLFRDWGVMKKVIEEYRENISNHKEEIIEKLMPGGSISRKHAKPFVECGIEIGEAFYTNRLPNYDKLYDILYKHLYPKGNKSPPIYFEWLTKKQRAASKNIKMVSIKDIPAPVRIAVS